MGFGRCRPSLAALLGIGLYRDNRRNVAGETLECGGRARNERRHRLRKVPFRVGRSLSPARHPLQRRRGADASRRTPRRRVCAWQRSRKGKTTLVCPVPRLGWLFPRLRKGKTTLVCPVPRLRWLFPRLRKGESTLVCPVPRLGWLFPRLRKGESTLVCPVPRLGCPFSRLGNEKAKLRKGGTRLGKGRPSLEERRRKVGKPFPWSLSCTFVRRASIQLPTPDAQRPTPDAQRPTPNAQRPTSKERIPTLEVGRWALGVCAAGISMAPQRPSRVREDQRARSARSTALRPGLPTRPGKGRCETTLEKSFSGLARFFLSHVCSCRHSAGNTSTIKDKVATL